MLELTFKKIERRKDKINELIAKVEEITEKTKTNYSSLDWSNEIPTFLNETMDYLTLTTKKNSEIHTIILHEHPESLGHLVNEISELIINLPILTLQNRIADCRKEFMNQSDKIFERKTVKE